MDVHEVHFYDIFHVYDGLWYKVWLFESKCIIWSVKKYKSGEKGLECYYSSNLSNITHYFLNKLCSVSINYLKCGGPPQSNLFHHSFIMNWKYFYTSHNNTEDVSHLCFGKPSRSSARLWKNAALKCGEWFYLCIQIFWHVRKLWKNNSPHASITSARTNTFSFWQQWVDPTGLTVTSNIIG